MSTSAPIGIDEFLELEQRILRAIDVLKHEREARIAAEAERDAALAEHSALQQRVEEQAREIETLESERLAHAAASETAQTELVNLQSEHLSLQDERSAVRQRIERMLHQMDELL